jgi:hypothetical protein
MYALMTYGIPHRLIPVAANGKIKLKNHMVFLDMRRAAEEYDPYGAVETCELPGNSDVLLGKGRPIQGYTGNRRLHGLIDEQLSIYHGFSNSKKQKTALSAEIVMMVQSKDYGGRFLSKESGVWIEVSDEVARDKVSNTFRTRLYNNRGALQVTKSKVWHGALQSSA